MKGMKKPDERKDRYRHTDRSSGERNAMTSAIRKADLMFIGQHWETVNLDFDKHKNEYVNRLYNLATGNPLLIDS